MRIILAALLVLMPTLALADNPHYLQADASFSTGDACYSVRLKEAGLGNSGFSSLTYTLSCTASYTVACFNRGGNQVQGQPKNGTSAASSQTVLNIRNGQTNGTVDLCPSEVDLPDPGCTGNQLEVILAASYSACTLADGLGTPSPSLPNLGGTNLFIVQ